MCALETWLKPELSFVLPGYVCLRRDGMGGGGAVFVRDGVKHRRKNVQSELVCRGGNLEWWRQVYID